MVKPQNEKQQRFMALFQPAQPRLQRFVHAMTRDAELTKDIVGETILIAFQRFETLRHQEAFLGFLFTIAARVARRHAPARNATALDEAEVENILDPTTPADVAADIDRLQSALQQLPAKQREAVLLFEIAGFSTAEVRDIQGGTLVAVRVRLARARKRLATLLGVDDPTAEPSPKSATAKSAAPHGGTDGSQAATLVAIHNELGTELGVQR